MNDEYETRTFWEQNPVFIGIIINQFGEMQIVLEGDVINWVK